MVTRETRLRTFASLFDVNLEPQTAAIHGPVKGVFAPKNTTKPAKNVIIVNRMYMAD